MRGNDEAGDSSDTLGRHLSTKSSVCRVHQGRVEPFGIFPSGCGETDGTDLISVTAILSRFQRNQTY